MRKLCELIREIKEADAFNDDLSNGLVALAHHVESKGATGLPKPGVDNLLGLVLHLCASDLRCREVHMDFSQ